MALAYVAFCEKDVRLVQEKDTAPSLRQLEVVLHFSFNFVWSLTDITCNCEVSVVLSCSQGSDVTNHMLSGITVSH